MPGKGVRIFGARIFLDKGFSEQGARTFFGVCVVRFVEAGQWALYGG
jgi:hypothetical protein